MKKTVTAALIAAVMLTGCSYSYSYTYRADTEEDDVSSDFRLPDADDLPADAQTSAHKGGKTEYTTGDGKFTFEVPDDENVVLVSDEDDYMLFNLEGRNDEQGSFIMLMSAENENNVDDILAGSGLVEGNEYREYRINDRRAAVMTQGTSDPLRTDEELCLYEQILIDYDDSVLIIISTAEENKSREEFFDQRVMIKDIIASVKYMGEE